MREPRLVEYGGNGSPYSTRGRELRLPTGGGTSWRLEIRPTTTYLPDGRRIIEWPDYPGTSPLLDLDSDRIIIEVRGEVPAPVGTRRRVLPPLGR